MRRSGSILSQLPILAMSTDGQHSLTKGAPDIDIIGLFIASTLCPQQRGWYRPDRIGGGGSIGVGVPFPSGEAQYSSATENPPPLNTTTS